MLAPTISVIVPVYNTEKYIHRCIDSVLSQTFPDFELLLIDDGSSDKSGEICDEYAKIDSRVRVFHKQNGGASSARNLGLEKAKGEWVAFVDSDDYVYENYLNNFDVYENQDFDLINQGLRIDKDFNGCSEFGFSFNGGINSWLNEATERGIFGYTVIKLFKLGIIRNNNIHFNTEIRFQEDELFVLSYLAVCKSVISVPLIGYFYFVPDWGKYIGGSVQSKLLRTNFMIDVLESKFENPEELLIYKKKKSSLLHYYLEANIQHLNWMYLKNLRELLQEGYKISKIPEILQKLIKVDSTLILSVLLITGLKLYSKLTKHKIEFI